MKPFIILTSGTQKTDRNMDQMYLYRNYMEIIRMTGGIPLTVVGTENEEPEQGDLYDLAKRMDGLFLTGGGDIDPGYFGQEEEQEHVQYDKSRDSLEYHLCRIFMEMKKPILGVCRGFQMINVVCGGTIYQDINNKLGISHPEHGMHPVCSVCGSWWEREYGSEFLVNSFHHQAIDRLGKGLKCTVCDKASGIVEAFEHEEIPVMGVQWHPERMTGQNPYTPGGQSMEKFIHRFIERCG